MGFFKKRSEDEAVAKTISPVEHAPAQPLEVKPQSAPTTPGGSMQGGAEPLATTQPAASEAGFDRFGKLRSALGPGTVIQGKLSFDTPVRIDGKLSGEIFSSQAIIVGATGSVEGDIDVASLVVLGVVRGKVRAQRVEVLKGGRLEADFTSPVFTIEDGGSFNGRAAMTPATGQVTRSTQGGQGEEAAISPAAAQLSSGALPTSSGAPGLVQ